MPGGVDEELKGLGLVEGLEIKLENILGITRPSV